MEIFKFEVFLSVVSRKKFIFFDIEIVPVMELFVDKGGLNFGFSKFG